MCVKYQYISPTKQRVHQSYQLIKKKKFIVVLKILKSWNVLSLGQRSEAVHCVLHKHADGNVLRTNNTATCNMYQGNNEHDYRLKE